MKTKKNTLILIFIILSGVFTSSVLSYYSFLLKEFVPTSNYLREYCICFGQIFFQCVLLLIVDKNKYEILEYIKQMMIVSLIGGFLLLPVFTFATYFHAPSVIYLIYFLCVVLFMFFNHKIRIKKVKAPQWLTYTWVLYRIIILLIIL